MIEVSWNETLLTFDAWCRRLGCRLLLMWRRTSASAVAPSFAVVDDSVADESTPAWQHLSRAGASCPSPALSLSSSVVDRSAADDADGAAAGRWRHCRLPALIAFQPRSVLSLPRLARSVNDAEQWKPVKSSDEAVAISIVMDKILDTVVGRSFSNNSTEWRVICRHMNSVEGSALPSWNFRFLRLSNSVLHCNILLTRRVLYIISAQGS